VDQKVLTAQFRASRAAGSFRADEYAPYLNVLRNAVGSLRRKVVLSKEKK
jgi:hypothetical protein